MSSLQTVRLSLTCDWSKADAPADVVLRRLLKMLLRTYNVRCLSCYMLPAETNAGAAPGAARRVSPGAKSRHGKDLRLVGT